MSLTHHHTQGFTLVELLIAVGLFAIIMLLSSGAYLMILGINQRVQSISSGIDNISFAYESMIRDIRTGNTYTCGATVTANPSPTNCPFSSNGNVALSFYDRKGNAVGYSVSGSTLQKTSGGTAVALTDPTYVTINSIRFYVSGAVKQPQDFTQPQVTIVIQATTVGKVKKTMMFQSGATMRGPDI